MGEALRDRCGVKLATSKVLEGCLGYKSFGGASSLGKLGTRFKQTASDSAWRSRDTGTCRRQVAETPKLCRHLPKTILCVQTRPTVHSKGVIHILSTLLPSTCFYLLCCRTFSDQFWNDKKSAGCSGDFLSMNHCFCVSA
jgi:hypothetical protein